MKKVIQLLAVIMLMLLTAVVTFAVTYQELGSNSSLQLQLGSQSQTAKKVDEIDAYLERYFIDEYDEGNLGDAAAEAMIAATGDRWSYYISADEYQSYVESAANAYVGIGVTIQANEEQNALIITSITEGSPAEEAGLQVSDQLIAVEGQLVADLDLDGVKELVRGEEGTSVLLKIRRDGEEFEKSVVRAAIQETVSTYTMLEGDIASIKIRNFDGDCAKQTIACIEQAQAEGAKALIFDVRFNPGGFKTELVTVLDKLLPEGVLFRSLDYDGNEETEYSDESYVDLPMAVLINEDTYSAAEFFAAAMQEYDAATIVGTQTSGKGNFQTTFNLSDGSAINISIGKYFTPNGKSLTDVGVEPDESVDLSDEDYAYLYYGQLDIEKDLQLQKALEILGKELT